MGVSYQEQVVGTLRHNRPQQAQGRLRALQLAAADLLEVEPREIGYDINDYQGDDGSRHRAIRLFDTADGGAGYVSSLPNEFGELFRRARRLLLCTGDETSGGCDKSCHSCLLSYSTQNSEGLLERRLALQFLTEKTLAGLCLPPGRAVFGEATRAEYDSLHALANRYGDGKGARRIRVHLTAEPERWDFAVWPGWEDEGMINYCRFEPRGLARELGTVNTESGAPSSGSTK